MLLHAPISIPPFRRSPLALPPQPEIRLIPLVRTGTVRTNGSHQHIPPAAIALTFRMPMPYPLKSPPLASEDEMPPPPDASLPVKPSGGERFSEILEEAELAYDPEHGISPRSIRIRAPEEVGERLDGEIEMALTCEMNTLSNQLVPQPESFKLRQRFLQKLQRIFDTEWPDKDITAHIFGSTVNGLGTVSSDVDVCLVTSWEDRKSGVANMHVLATVLRKHGMTGIYTVAAAKVPICKFYDPEYNVNCDINVNNSIALQNTRLIRAYVDIDPRVKPLMLVLKYWTRRRALNDAAKGGTLSSYCWMMMVLNFLQMRQPPIVPCLHEMYFEKLKADPHQVTPVIVNGVDCSFYDDLDSLQGFGERNHETLGALLYAFFRRYAIEFNYDAHVVSVRHGRYLTKEEKGWDMDINRMCRFLCVEEPFNPQRNLANSADGLSVAGLRKEFDRALTILESGGGLDTACEEWIPHRLSFNPLTPLMLNGQRPFIGDMTPNKLRTDPFAVFRAFDAYRSQLDQGVYNYKANGQMGPNFFYNNHHAFNQGNTSMTDRRTNGHIDNADRRLAGLELLRGGPRVPYTAEDLHRLQSLSLETSRLPSKPHSRLTYANYSDRRRADFKRTAMPNTWTVTSQTAAGLGSYQRKEADTGKKVAERRDISEDEVSRGQPIMVVIEKQVEGENTTETIVSEITSGGRSRTLSCSRSDAGPEYAPSRHTRTPEPHASPSPDENTNRPASSSTESPTLPPHSSLHQPHSSQEHALPLSESIPRGKSPNGRRSPLPHELLTPPNHSGRASPREQDDRPQPNGRISPKKHGPTGDPDRDRRKSPTKLEAYKVSNSDRDLRKGPKNSPREYLDDNQQGRLQAYKAEQQASETGQHSKRRGSKGTLLWANHSHRVDTRSTGTNTRRTALNGISEPSTPKAEDEPSLEPQRGRDTESRDKNGKDQNAWARPRSLSASATPKSPWQDVRSAKSPERINSARVMKSAGRGLGGPKDAGTQTMSIAIPSARRSSSPDEEPGSPTEERGSGRRRSGQDNLVGKGRGKGRGSLDAATGYSHQRRRDASR